MNKNIQLLSTFLLLFLCFFILAGSFKVQAIEEKELQDFENRLLSLEDSKVLNVMDYGAKGNNIADDTKAIRDAIAAALKLGQATVYFPSGKYKITQSIIIEGDASKLLALKGEDGGLNNTLITGKIE